MDVPPLSAASARRCSVLCFLDNAPNQLRGEAPSAAFGCYSVLRICTAHPRERLNGSLRHIHGIAEIFICQTLAAQF